jgi:hypothetical protein
MTASGHPTIFLFVTNIYQILPGAMEADAAENGTEIRTGLQLCSVWCRFGSYGDR